MKPVREKGHKALFSFFMQLYSASAMKEIEF